MFMPGMYPYCAYSDCFQKKVFLQIFVKVEPDWRENKKMLRKFGYIQD